MVVSKIRSRYTCDDCKWNFLCPEGQRRRCSEFELDYIMSDKYVERLIARGRKQYIVQWYENIYDDGEC